MRPGDGALCDRPQRLQYPPHRPDLVRGFRDPPRLDGIAVGVERDRDRIVGHYGKICGQPVYNLLGGPSRERVRIYANGWAGRSTIEEGVERGRKIKAMGFTAAEIRPVSRSVAQLCRSPRRGFRDRLLRAMRDALGPDFEILVEAHRRFAPQHAIRIGNRLAEFNIDWYEEPCLPTTLPCSARCGAPCRSRSSPARRFIQRNNSPAVSRRERRIS